MRHGADLDLLHFAVVIDVLDHVVELVGSFYSVNMAPGLPSSGNARRRGQQVRSLFFCTR